jgi:hypothetical protein
MILQILKFTIGTALIGMVFVGTLMLPDGGWKSAGAVADGAVSDYDGQLAATGLPELHREFVNHFANTQDFGYERMPRMHHLSNLPLEWTAKDDGTRWHIKSYYLVGIFKSPQPRVYLDNKPPKMLAQPESVQCRPLDAFEQNGLSELRAGRDLVVDRSDPARLRVLGSLRATGTCVNCHQEPAGSLLGAFTYDLDRDFRAVDGS